VETQRTTPVLEMAAMTHQGMVRGHNEDTVFADPVGLAVLADGMGGYSAGEVASGIAVRVLVEGMLPPVRARRPMGKVDVASGLSHAGQLVQKQVGLANKGIFDAAAERPECAGMGTTLVVAVFYENRVCVAHVGDSRCYRLRGDRLEQLTRDHSLLQEQIDSGLLTAEQARYSLNKNLVTRALGIDAIVPADIAEYRLDVGDVYLLCSDGLTDMVEPDQLRDLLMQGGDLDTVAKRLVDAANQNGGRDNVSVVLVRVPPDYLPKKDWARQWKEKAATKADDGGSAPPRA
jgi:protein phosphatase